MSSSGRVAVREPVHAELGGVGAPLYWDAGSISLEDNRVTADGLRGRYGLGEWNAAGSAELGANLEPQRYDLRLHATDLAFEQGPVALRVDATLHAQGEGAWPRISGEVVVLSGHVRRHLSLGDLQGMLTGRAAPKVERPWLAQIPLDIRLSTDQPLALSAGMPGALLAEAFLSASLRVEGSAALPLISGQIYGQRGTLEFPYADLELTSFTTDLTPAPAGGLEGIISLRASGPVALAGAVEDEYYVTLSVEGTLQDPRISIDAQPALSQASALTLLLAGRADPMDIGQGGGGGSSLTGRDALMFAGAQLTAPATRLVQNELRRLLDVELDLATTMGADSVQVEVSQSLADRVRLSGYYQQGLADAASESGGGLQLVLSDALRFQARSWYTLNGSNDAEAELELRYRLLGP